MMSEKVLEDHCGRPGNHAKGKITQAKSKIKYASDNSICIT